MDLDWFLQLWLGYGKTLIARFSSPGSGLNQRLPCCPSLFTNSAGETIGRLHWWCCNLSSPPRPNDRNLSPGCPSFSFRRYPFLHLLLQPTRTLPSSSSTRNQPLRRSAHSDGPPESPISSTTRPRTRPSSTSFASYGSSRPLAACSRRFPVSLSPLPMKISLWGWSETMVNLKCPRKRWRC